MSELGLSKPSPEEIETSEDAQRLEVEFRQALAENPEFAAACAKKILSLEPGDNTPDFRFNTDTHRWSVLPNADAQNGIRRLSILRRPLSGSVLDGDEPNTHKSGTDQYWEERIDIYSGKDSPTPNLRSSGGVTCWDKNSGIFYDIFDSRNTEVAERVLADLKTPPTPTVD